MTNYSVTQMEDIGIEATRFCKNAWQLLVDKLGGEDNFPWVCMGYCLP